MVKIECFHRIMPYVNSLFALKTIHKLISENKLDDANKAMSDILKIFSSYKDIEEKVSPVIKNAVFTENNQVANLNFDIISGTKFFLVETMVNDILSCER